MKLPKSFFDPRKTDTHCCDLSEAFDICRERDRPIIVTLDVLPTGVPAWVTDKSQYKIYPSGHALVAIDGENPFQKWEETRYERN